MSLEARFFLSKTQFATVFTLLFERCPSLSTAKCLSVWFKHYLKSLHCVRSVMLHAAETWAVTVATLNRLRRNDAAMIRWICNVKANDEVSSDSLLSNLGLQDIDVVLWSSRMRWYGHVECSKGWISQVCKLNVVAQKRSDNQGNHGMKCCKTTENS